MKIIEALKELPLIEKKVTKNAALIEKYASEVDNGSPTLLLEEASEHRKEVTALLQSTNDLVDRAGKIRRALAMTNANTDVTIEGVTKSITEWIAFREQGHRLKRRALDALNDSRATSVMNSTPFDPEKGIRVMRFYDEREKNEAIQKIDDIQGQLDARLEIVNATTDLTEEV